MSYSDDATKLRTEGFEEGVRWFLRNFLGVSSLCQLKAESATALVVVSYSAESASGGSESRRYKLDSSMTPEQIMAKIAEARQRQAWYARQSDDVDVGDIDPNYRKPELQEEPAPAK